MGFVEFVLTCILICVVAYAATVGLKYLAPEHPPIIDRIIWVVAVVIIIVILLRATGLLSWDVQIPKVK